MPKGIKGDHPMVAMRLDKEVYDTLVEFAKDEERPVNKQAAFFMKKGMKAHAEESL